MFDRTGLYLKRENLSSDADQATRFLPERREACIVCYTNTKVGDALWRVTYPELDLNLGEML